MAVWGLSTCAHAPDCSVVPGAGTALGFAFKGPSEIHRMKMMPGDRKDQYRRNSARGGVGGPDTRFGAED